MIDLTVDITEPQRGDPDTNVENLSLTAQSSADLAASSLAVALRQPSDSTGDKAVRREPGRLFAQQLLTTAAAEVGVSRISNPARVAEYLSLFGLGFTYSNGSYVPFCAAGVGWAICKSYCDLPPLPTDGYTQITYNPVSELKVFKGVFYNINAIYCPLSAGCAVIESAANATHRWSPPVSVPLPGWLVIYNWDGKQDAEHIGIVDSATVDSLMTIEFNTRIDSGPGQGNGGAVARKDRQKLRGCILGYVKTY